MSVTVAARINTPYGWLYLGEGTQYRIAAGSFEDKQVSFRRSEVTNPFVEGTFVVNALRENVTESLSVWVEDRESLLLADAVESLGAALSQVTFTMQVQLRSDVYTWNAYASDYTVSSKREFLHARIAQVNAEIPRDPSVVRERVAFTYEGLADANYTNAQLSQYLLSYGRMAADPTLMNLTTQVAWPVPEGS